MLENQGNEGHIDFILFFPFIIVSFVTNLHTKIAFLLFGGLAYYVRWKESEYSGGQFIPVGGLAYYVTAPAR